MSSALAPLSVVESLHDAIPVYGRWNNLCIRHFNWMDHLSMYDCKVTHIPRTNNDVADTFSRQWPVPPLPVSSAMLPSTST